MARRVFFSFHFQRDIFRVNVVRNHWLTKPDHLEAGFYDASLWEEAKKKGDAAVKNLIDAKLNGTSVTAVLIGLETYERKYVLYEIEKSIRDGKGLVGIYIHDIKDISGKVDPRGKNPFDEVRVKQGSITVPASQIYPSYHWTTGMGYANFTTWVETAATAAGR
jgi:Thoeris protein ThsB, TIR-like domain